MIYLEKKKKGYITCLTKKQYKDGTERNNGVLLSKCAGKGKSSAYPSA